MESDNESNDFNNIVTENAMRIYFIILLSLLDAHFYKPLFDYKDYFDFCDMDMEKDKKTFYNSFSESIIRLGLFYISRNKSEST